MPQRYHNEMWSDEKNIHEKTVSGEKNIHEKTMASNNAVVLL